MTFKISRTVFDGSREVSLGEPFADLASCEAAMEKLLKDMLAQTPRVIRGHHRVVLHTGRRQDPKPYFVVYSNAGEHPENLLEYGLHYRCDVSDGMRQLEIDEALVKLAEKLQMPTENDY